MIRPVTVATFLLACGSGLYLYQSKHEVQVLDRTIERSVRDTNVLREQSRLLAAEWTMLNDPERLRQFSDTYLQLKTITPSQFSSLADLDNRLPAPRIETPAPESEEDQVPVTVDNGPQPIAASDPAVAMPVPPVPGTHAAPAVASAPHAVEIKAADVKAAAKPANSDAAPHAAAVAEVRPPESRGTETHGAQRTAEPHIAGREPTAPAPRPILLASPRPLPVAVPPGPAQARPQTPSVLAAKAAPTLPAPVPMASATPAHVALLSSTRVALVSSTHPASAAPPTVAAPTPIPAVSASPMPAAPASPMQAAQASGFGGSLLGMARGGVSPSPRPTPMNASYRTN